MSIASLRKSHLIASLQSQLARSPLVLVVLQNNPKIQKVNALRSKLTPLDAKLVLCKNSLTRLAIKDTRAEGIAPLLHGQANLLFAQEPVSVVKALDEYMKANANDFVLAGGIYEGVLLNQARLKELREMEVDPSQRRELQMKQLAQLMQAPTMGFYGLVNASAKKWVGLVRIRDMLEKKQTEEKLAETKSADKVETASS